MGTDTLKLDLLIVGGGLWGSLAAAALKRHRPEVRFLLLEAGPRLGGSHTWSYHDSDVPDSMRDIVRAASHAHWDEHEVRFPARTRRLATGYGSMTDQSLHDAIAPLLGDSLRLGTRFDPASAPSAAAVWDVRGFAPFTQPGSAPVTGFQKFVGYEVALAKPHGLRGPILMDATVPQLGDYRFVYTLPFGERTVLIEDTRYSDTDAIDEAHFDAEIRAYAKGQGWEITTVIRKEIAALPIPFEAAYFDQCVPVPPLASELPIPGGTRAGLFHEVTGYSVPNALAFIDALIRIPDLKAHPRATLRALTLETLAATRWQRHYLLMLSRMLFRAAEPDLRYRIFERFYGLSEGLIQRFYAGRLQISDAIRIVAGKPPVPILRALKTL